MKKILAKVAAKKPPKTRRKILDAIEIFSNVKVPVNDLTARRLEKMAMSLLALCNIKPGSSWNQAESIENNRALGTREIIKYINANYKEKISLSSYDDIRRKDLLRPVGMGLIVKSANNPDADTNDGTRGYAISEAFSGLIKSYGTANWEEELARFKVDQDYVDQFHKKRQLNKLEVKLSDDISLSLDDGPHNQLQKAVVESFLPVYGYGATVLYMGDTSEKQLHKYSEQMSALGLDIADRGMLPDIIAFSEEKQWVYLIEAVHSSNPLNPERCIELQRTVLKNCLYGVVFVTAFLSRKDFAKWLPQIAWETEVWLAENPHHMIHFNGDRFFGPHTSTPHQE